MISGDAFVTLLPVALCPQCYKEVSLQSVSIYVGVTLEALVHSRRHCQHMFATSLF